MTPPPAVGAGATGIHLPLFGFMDDDVLERVIDGVVSFFRGA